MIDWNVGRTVRGGDQHRSTGSKQRQVTQRNPIAQDQSSQLGNISDKGVIFPIVKNRWVMNYTAVIYSELYGKTFLEDWFRIDSISWDERGTQIYPVYCDTVFFCRNPSKRQGGKRIILIYITGIPMYVYCCTDFGGIFKTVLTDSNSFIWCQFKQDPGSKPLMTLTGSPYLIAITVS